MIQVALLGGHMCGKSTVLASMYEQLVHGVFENYFSVLDVTDYGRSVRLEEGNLHSKKLELLEVLERQSNRHFMHATNPGHIIQRYTLRVKLHGKRNYIDVSFVDVPGSVLLNDYAWDYININQLVYQSDVIVIAIDTPYLMEANDVVNSSVNCIDSLNYSLCAFNEESAKMVVFMPVKCEKWVKEERIDEVVEQVITKYSTLIKTACSFESMNVCVLPVETVGNILFTELKESYIVQINNIKYQCCKCGKDYVRLSDGSIRSLSDTELSTLAQDVSAVIPSYTFVHKPQSWFHVNPNSNKYEPKNCDQLMLHILWFMSSKLLRESRDPLMEYWFGGDLRAERAATMKTIKEVVSGLVKNETEGIIYIKKDI